MGGKEIGEQPRHRPIPQAATLHTPRPAPRKTQALPNSSPRVFSASPRLCVRLFQNCHRATARSNTTEPAAKGQSSDAAVPVAPHQPASENPKAVPPQSPARHHSEGYGSNCVRIILLKTSRPRMQKLRIPNCRRTTGQRDHAIRKMKFRSIAASDRGQEKTGPRIVGNHHPPPKAKPPHAGTPAPHAPSQLAPSARRTPHAGHVPSSPTMSEVHSQAEPGNPQKHICVHSAFIGGS